MSKQGIKKTPPRRRRFVGSDRGLAALLVLLVAYVFFVYPLLGGSALGGWGSVIFSLILVVSVLATSTHHAVRGVIVVLAAITMASHWISAMLGGRVDLMVAAGAAIIFFSMQNWFLSVRVFGRGAITTYSILGAVAIYLVFGLLWANAYALMYLAIPDAFYFDPGAKMSEPPLSEMIYFSFVTLTTLGFGDITAVHPFARSLVTMEGLVGQLYPAIVLARLVTRYEVHHPRS